MRGWAIAWALAVAGCGSGSTGSDGGADQARPRDLAAAGDSATAGDLAGTDDLALAAEDLAVGPDFAGADLAGYSDVGGPCGGFTANPKMCLPGLDCVANKIPDLPGTCERPDGG